MIVITEEQGSIFMFEDTQSCYVLSLHLVQFITVHFGEVVMNLFLIFKSLAHLHE